MPTTTRPTPRSATPAREERSLAGPARAVAPPKLGKLPRLADPAERTISEVAEQTGVPIATIKYYIREKLLPRPRVAGRTVGRYDAAFVQRLELVRELRSRFRLSLREIGTLLSEAGPGSTLTEIELRLLNRERIDGAIDPTHAQPPVPASRLVERSGLPPEDIAELIKCGLLTPIKVDGAFVYAERDARIADVVGALRSSGFNQRLGFAISDLRRYVEALRTLVVREVEQFDDPALSELPRDEMLNLIGQGVAHIDVLLSLLHKKLLLAAVHDRLDAAAQSRVVPPPPVETARRGKVRT